MSEYYFGNGFEVQTEPNPQKFVKVYTGEIGDTPYELVNFIAWLNGILNKIPPEYRNDVRIDNLFYNNNDEDQISIWYLVDKTEEELIEDRENKRQSDKDWLHQELKEFFQDFGEDHYKEWILSTVEEFHREFEKLDQDQQDLKW